MNGTNHPDRGDLLYFDDMQVGDRFSSSTQQIDQAQIYAFAKQFDPQPFHLDAETAKHTGVWRARGQRLAHGRHLDAPVGGKRLADFRRARRSRRRDHLAAANAAGRHAARRGGNRRPEAVALAARPGCRDASQRNA